MANRIPTPKSHRCIRGQRYRLQFINKQHRTIIRCICTGIVSSFALGTSPASAPRDIAGIIKDVVLVDAQTEAEVEFTADNPGMTLFHCHQQNHMDLGS